MRLKNLKEHQVSSGSTRRSGYRHGEKIVIFFKRCIIVLSVFILIAVVILCVKMLEPAFLIKDIQISGNHHLEEDEIKSVLGIRNGKTLFRLSFDEIETRLRHLPWIKEMFLRKQFPYTLVINIKEAVPKALLRLNNHVFFVDSDGNILQEITGEGIPFLPVIIEINPKKDRGGILEALKLIDAMSEKNILSGRDSIEIMLSSYGLMMNIDGESIRVGYGEYKEKLGRWKELEPEIRGENIDIDYVDLRFKDRVIVKPFKGERVADARK